MAYVVKPQIWCEFSTNLLGISSLLISYAYYTDYGAEQEQANIV